MPYQYLCGICIDARIKDRKILAQKPNLVDPVKLTRETQVYYMVVVTKHDVCE